MLYSNIELHINLKNVIRIVINALLHENIGLSDNKQMYKTNTVRNIPNNSVISKSGIRIIFKKPHKDIKKITNKQ